MAQKKLFELLVVEPQLKAQVQQTRTELRGTFEKKRHLFEEKRVTFASKEEGKPPVVEEQSDIQSSIVDELEWMAGIWSKAIDTSYQVAEGNTKARANVTLDDGTTTLLENVPATALLELEKRMGELQELIKAIPTLDPAKGFQLDPNHREKHVFIAREVHKNRTQKIQKPIVLYDATPEHPAQTQLISADEVSGTIMQQEWSSLITPARKGILIERVEEIRRALKAALHRANALVMDEPLTIAAKKIFDFVLKN